MEPSRGKIKETVLLVLLHILLPTVDIFTDLLLVGRFYYYGEHPGWGTMMFLPFLANYTISWYAWFHADKRKMIGALAALFCWYPQYKTVEVIRLVWTEGLAGGLAKKSQFQRDIAQYEVFCESVPSTLTVGFLLVQAAVLRKDGMEHLIDLNSKKDVVLFGFSFGSSFFSASFGMAKSLKVGPCRILAQTKSTIEGLLSPRFILIFFSIAVTFAGKALALATSIAARDECTELLDEYQHTASAVAIITTLCPGFFTALFACYHHRMIKTFLAHPSIYLLPAFTHFTFATTKLSARKDEESSNVGGGGEAETFIAFSPKYTAVNIALSFAGQVAYFVVLYPIEQRWDCHLSNNLKLDVSVFMAGSLLTLFITFDSKVLSWYANTVSTEYGALHPAQPQVPFVLRGQEVVEEVVLGQLATGNLQLAIKGPVEPDAKKCAGDSSRSY